MGFAEPAHLENAAAFSVKRISDAAALRGLISDWDDLYQRDNEASFFLSPTWLAPVLAERPAEWVVLAAYDGIGSLAGLLPLWRRAFRHRVSGARRIELEAAGRLVWSDHTGILCAPDTADAVLDSLAIALNETPWTHLVLPFMADASRSRRLASGLGPDCSVGFAKMPGQNARGEIDRLPYIALPERYRDYLDATLSARVKAQIEAAFTRFVESGRLYIVDAALAPGFPYMLETALDLWREKASVSPAQVDRYRSFCLDLRERNLLSMPCLHEGTQLIGALINIVDRRDGYEFSKLMIQGAAPPEVPVSLLLHAWAIQQAIAGARLEYDLGPGTQAWKYALGAQDRFVHSLIAKRF